MVSRILTVIVYLSLISVYKAKENQKSFFKKYGSAIVINGALLIITNSANAQDNIPTVPQKGVEAPKPTPSPVFKPIIPPSGVIATKAWSVTGVISIVWICTTAAATGNPALLFACGSLVNYVIGAKP